MTLDLYSFVLRGELVQEAVDREHARNTPSDDQDRLNRALSVELLDNDKVRVAGTCAIGGEILCSTEGCLRTCAREGCGATVCRRHSRVYGGKTICLRCRFPYLLRTIWRKFWGLD